tara:strand:+ start:159 stop:350 length:192 start_codon:yes stop_codon:yes gene_type:complete
MASLRKKGKSYYVRYKIDGSCKERKLGRNISKRVANQLLQRVEERLAFELQNRKDDEAGFKRT